LILTVRRGTVYGIVLKEVRVYMKIRFSLFLCCLFFCSLSLFAADGLPAPMGEGEVSDFAGVIKDEDSRDIENLAKVLEQKTGAELAVVTIQTFAPYGSIEEYATSLFNSWGIGQAGEDNGVLLILAVEDREVKIETGYGLEGAIPDSMAGRILDNAVLPLFKEDNFSGGLLQGAQAIAAAVAKDKGISAEEIEQLGVPASVAEAIEKKGLGSFLYFLIFVGVVFIIAVIAMVIMFRRLGVGGGGGYSMPRQSYRNSSSGSSSSGSSSRSGGGRSGGGGASRKF
jgi:uncharacterized protein